MLAVRGLKSKVSREIVFPGYFVDLATDGYAVRCLPSSEGVSLDVTVRQAVNSLLMTRFARLEGAFVMASIAALDSQRCVVYLVTVETWQLLSAHQL